jgi:hypothetical protein
MSHAKHESDLPQSGITGVRWNVQRGKWLVQIGVNRRNQYVGLFDDLAEAIAARQAAEAKVRDVVRPTIEKGQRISSFEVEIMRQTMLDILTEDHPQSVRHVFYRMTDHRLPFYVGKTEDGYALVRRQLGEMRKQGQLPYSWISDATRMGYHVATYGSPGDFIRAHAGLFRGDIWAKANTYCEVWTESRSAASVIRDDCQALGVSLYPSGGFTSLTLAYEAAVQIADTVRDTDRDIEIVYIGDWDRSGVLIDVDIEKKLRGHLSDFGVGNHFNMRRLAITQDQIATYDLPRKPAKTKDSRARHITETVEVEALPAGILRRMLRETVEAFLPEHALKVTKVNERSEQVGLLKLASLLDSGDIDPDEWDVELDEDDLNYLDD